MLEAPAESIKWEPYSLEFQKNEGAYTDGVGEPSFALNRHLNYFVSENHDLSDTIILKLSSLTTKEKQLYTGAEELAHKWRIEKMLAEA